MKKIVLLLATILICSYSFYGQTVQPYKKRNNKHGYIYPNVVKVNTLALPFQNVSLSYERAIIPRLSVVVGIGYKYSGTTPSLLTVNGAFIATKMEAVTGYSFSPEIRYYLKSCEDKYLEGFYAGLYFRYSHFQTRADFIYFPTVDVNEKYSAVIKLDEVGVGLQLGYQLVLWKRFNIDFMFFGPRMSKYTMNYAFDQNVSQRFLDDLSDGINEILSNFEIDYEVELEQIGNSSASAGFLFANMRFGISFGFAF